MKISEAPAFWWRKWPQIPWRLKKNKEFREPLAGKNIEPWAPELEMKQSWKLSVFCLELKLME